MHNKEIFIQHIFNIQTDDYIIRELKITITIKIYT